MLGVAIASLMRARLPRDGAVGRGSDSPCRPRTPEIQRLLLGIASLNGHGAHAADGAPLGPPLDCPMGLAATGLLPVDATLEVAAQALRAWYRRRRWVSRMRSLTPMAAFFMARTRFWREPGRALRVQPVGVDGPQIAQWAELQAMLWVAEGSVGAVLLFLFP